MAGTSRISGDLSRIANALEHIAWSQIIHPDHCDICRARKRPVKRMPQSVVINNDRLRKREGEIRTQKMLHGPEEPVADMFRYRELNRDT